MILLVLVSNGEVNFMFIYSWSFEMIPKKWTASGNLKCLKFEIWNVYFKHLIDRC